MRLALIGVGLIGGSFAKALRVAGRAQHIVGFDVDQRATEQALALEVIDESAGSAAVAVRGVDLVLLSTPVGAMRETFRDIASHLSKETILTDTGSTKSSVIEAARGELGAAFSRFIPGHPIAGGERSGVGYADARLFHDRVFISTPVAQTEEHSTRKVEALWQSIGCRVQRMTPENHDNVFAAVSHLPHVLSYALVAQIANEPNAAMKFSVAGPAFRDFTRIAASSPTLWVDICLANRSALLAELGGYRSLLEDLQDALQRGDGSALQRVFDLGKRGAST